jgi:hypothetical protein
MRPAPQVGWSCLNRQAASRRTSGVAGVARPQAWDRVAHPSSPWLRKARQRGRTVSWESRNSVAL